MIATPHSTIAIYSLARFRLLIRVGQMNAPTMAKRDKCVSLSFRFSASIVSGRSIWNALPAHSHWTPLNTRTCEVVAFFEIRALETKPAPRRLRRINAERRASRQRNFIVKLQTIEMRRLYLICTLKCIQFSPLPLRACVELICIVRRFCTLAVFGTWPGCNVRQISNIYINAFNKMNKMFCMYSSVSPLQCRAMQTTWIERPIYAFAVHFCFNLSHPFAFYHYRTSPCRGKSRQIRGRALEACVRSILSLWTHCMLRMWVCGGAHLTKPTQMHSFVRRKCICPGNINN